MCANLLFAKNTQHIHNGAHELRTKSQRRNYERFSTEFMRFKNKSNITEQRLDFQML